MGEVHPLKTMIENRMAGIKCGIYSACTANDLVIKACMKRAGQSGRILLVEATANQVNQFGGYTGMMPADFREFVFRLAAETGLPACQVIIGGDHLGPLTWKSEKAAQAMTKAQELIRQYVLAGFTKIHIDASMHLADDDHSGRLADSVIAERTAVLCGVAEKAWQDPARIDLGLASLVYVIGSEVPIPGGSQEKEVSLQITSADDFEKSVAAFQETFRRHGLAAAWQNVIAMVVQPGVEFGDSSIHDFNLEAAQSLCEALKKYSNLVFEGHSTDYQTTGALRQMVESGIAILKVGPALTFALREALFALNHMETELLGNQSGISLSNFIEVLEKAMINNPANWQQHYHGDEQAVFFARKYSFSDRARYYLPLPEVQASIARLIRNLESVEIPLTLIDQFMPIQFQKIRSGQLENKPSDLLQDRIINIIDDYLDATRPEDLTWHQNL
jgi:D-tagatose-1,6-bisphosphate aldolase subunit GatZ/KbaZ